jgi:PRC-barrel domain
MTKILIPALAAVTFAAASSLSTLTFAEEPRIPAGVFTNAQTADQYLARDQLIGAKVHGADGKIIGDIEDLIINDYNLVTGVVMGTGGFMGIAEKKIGVNVQALKFGEKDGKPEISLPEATPEVLAAVQAYERMQPKKSLLERAKEKAQEITDKSTASAKAAAEGAKPTLDSAAEKTKEAYEKAKEAAQPAMDAAKDAVNKAVDKASEAIGSTPAPEPAPEAPKP